MLSIIRVKGVFLKDIIDRDPNFFRLALVTSYFTDKVDGTGFTAVENYITAFQGR